MTEPGWPTATLDPITRAKILGRSIPSAAWRDAIIEVPYPKAWSWITDLERSVPSFDRVVSQVRVRQAHRMGVVRDLDLMVSNYGIPIPFKARIEDGFCRMQARARLYLVVMAATPLDGGAKTHLLHLEAVPLPGTGLLRPFIQREVDNDLANMSRLLAE
jgi:hypothetical protein